MDTLFSPALAFGRPALFTFDEIFPQDVPSGLHLYRSQFGAVICAEPLPVDETEIQPQDLELCASGCHTLAGYAASLKKSHD